MQMTSQMHSRYGGFPPPSKLLDKIWGSNNYRKHRRRLRSTKPMLNIKPPREFHHLQLQVSKLQQEQERQAEIARQNQQILEKLVEIKQSPARVDHQNLSYAPKRDRLKRRRERRQRVIDRENRLMEERIQNAGPYYNIDEWEKDYQKHLYYLSLMENTTKDFDEMDEEYEQTGTYSESEDEEEAGAAEEEDDRDSEKSQEKLPALPKKKKQEQKSTKKSKGDKEKEVKLPPIENNKGKTDRQDKINDKGKKGTNDSKGDNGSEGAASEDSDDATRHDAEALHDAIEGDDKQKVLEILGKSSEKEQFEKLGNKYKELYDSELLEDAKSKLDEDLRKALTALGSPAEDDATRLHEAIKGLGTDEDTLIQILCTRSNAELEAIRESYHKKFEKSLEEDLKGDTSGDFETLLVQLSKGTRDKSAKVDRKLAGQDAKDLLEAGVDSWGTEEGTFIRVLTQRSFPQLKATIVEYQKLDKGDLAATIENEASGDFQKACLAIVSRAQNPSGFLANKLHEALQEGNDVTVAKILLPMNKVELGNVAASHKKEQKRELRGDVGKYCHGDTKTILLAKFDGENKKEQQKGKDSKAKSGASKKSSVAKKDSAGAKDRNKGQGGPSKEAAATKENTGAKGKNKDGNGTSKPSVTKKDSNRGAKDKNEAGEDTSKSSGGANKSGSGKTDKNKTAAEAAKAEEKDKSADDEVAGDECDQLHDAIKGDESDKIKEIVSEILEDGGKLKELQKNFNDRYSKDLLDALEESKLEEGYLEAVAAQLLSLAQYQARILHQAMKGIGTKEKVLIETLCSLGNSEMAAMKTEYKNKYDRSLEEDLKDDTSGDFEQLLIELCKGERDELTEANEMLAHQQAEALLDAGIKKFGTDEDKFIEIFTKQSFPQLRAMLVEYKTWAKCDMEDSIKQEMDGDLADGLLTLVACIRDSGKMKADKLHTCLLEDDVKTVVRIILLGAETGELKGIQEAYDLTYEPTLSEELEKRSPNELKNVLLRTLKGRI